MVAPKISGSSLLNLLLVTLMVPRIVRWLRQFRKICAPLDWLLLCLCCSFWENIHERCLWVWHHQW